MAEVNGTDHLVRHEKENKLNGYDNEGFHHQARCEEGEESSSDDDRLRIVVTENGHRPGDISNGYLHDDSPANGTAVVMIEDKTKNSSTETQKPLDTRLHHYVSVEDVDKKILNTFDNVSIPGDAVINMNTGRVKVKKGASSNPISEQESIPLETMPPSYDEGENVSETKKWPVPDLSNHKNGAWSEGNNTHRTADGPFLGNEKLNGTSTKSNEEVALPVNNHRKCLRGEKLYFTEDSRKLCPGWRRVLLCGLILIILAIALLLGVLAATGILLAESENKNTRYESGHSLPSVDKIAHAGPYRPRQPSKVPQKSLPEDATTQNATVSTATSSPVTSKVPFLNDTSHSQTIVPNALVGEFTITDENFTEDLKDRSSSGFSSLATHLEAELRRILKRSGGLVAELKILSFSPGSIRVKFVAIWASERNVIHSERASEILKSYLGNKHNLLLAFNVDLDSVFFIDVFDECRVQRGGCSFNCMWDYSTLTKTCTCDSDMELLEDGKSCGPKQSSTIMPTTLKLDATTTSKYEPEFFTSPKTEPEATLTSKTEIEVVTSKVEDLTTVFSVTEAFAIPKTESDYFTTSKSEPEFSTTKSTTPIMELSNVQTGITTPIPTTLVNVITTLSDIISYLTSTESSIISHSSIANDSVFAYENNVSTELPTESSSKDLSIVENITEEYSTLGNITTTLIPTFFSDFNTSKEEETTPKVNYSSTNFLPSETTDEATPSFIESTILIEEHNSSTEVSNPKIDDNVTIGYHIKEETTAIYDVLGNSDVIVETTTLPPYESTESKENNSPTYLTKLPENAELPNATESAIYHSSGNPVTTDNIGDHLNSERITESMPFATSNAEVAETTTLFSVTLTATSNVTVAHNSSKIPSVRSFDNFTDLNENETFISSTDYSLMDTTMSNIFMELEKNGTDAKTTSDLDFQPFDTTSPLIDTTIPAVSEFNTNSSLASFITDSTTPYVVESNVNTSPETTSITEGNTETETVNKSNSETTSSSFDTTVSEPSIGTESSLQLTTPMPSDTLVEISNNVTGDISASFPGDFNNSTHSAIEHITQPEFGLDFNGSLMQTTTITYNNGTSLEISSINNSIGVTDITEPYSVETATDSTVPYYTDVTESSEPYSTDVTDSTEPYDAETASNSNETLITFETPQTPSLHSETTTIYTSNTNPESESTTTVVASTNTVSLSTEPTTIQDQLMLTVINNDTTETISTPNYSNGEHTINVNFETTTPEIVNLNETTETAFTEIQNYTFPTPPFMNETEDTTDYPLISENVTNIEFNSSTLTIPIELGSDVNFTTTIPYGSFLDTQPVLWNNNDSMENSTYLENEGNFTTDAYDITTNETTTNATTGLECREDQFICEPLNKCINNSFMCDGIEDCPDGHDEFECKDTCHSNFMCTNTSTCVMSEVRCDGIWDCENGTDETDCTPTECAKHEVMCSDGSKCIKPSQICDWKYNCLDRSDEVGCVERTTCESGGRFFCNDGLCIPWSLKCDGEYDCKDREDEGNCTCLNDEFQCNDGKCLKSSSRCDGHQDCHDADDEMGCVTVDTEHIVSTYEPYSGTWGLLCAEDWNLDDGQYLCQELGFGHALKVEKVHVSFNGTWMAMKRDNLTATSLWTERVSFVESCTTSLAAAVECQKFACGEYTGLLHRRKRDLVGSSSSPWPFIGYASTFHTNKGCLSEILTPIWLITSAECLLSISKEPFNGSDWYVRTNIGRDIEADLAQNHEVLRIITHPHSSKFRSLTLRDYDVALIRLKHALVFVSDKIGAICLPEEQVPPGITCFSGVLGTEKPRALPPPTLTINSLALQIIERKNCNLVEHFNDTVNHRMLCTQSSEGHTICDNDEGTPLMCLTGINKWFLAGMLTYQRYCDVYNKHPAVFSNLFFMRKFLDQVTGQKQYELPYDSSIYIIIPPTTPSPTMPETTTLAMVMTSVQPNTTLFNTTIMEFYNETETSFSDIENINGTTAVYDELAREELFTTEAPETMMDTFTPLYGNETTEPINYEFDVINGTSEELLVDEPPINKTHHYLVMSEPHNSSLTYETNITDGIISDNFSVVMAATFPSTEVTGISSFTSEIASFNESESSTLPSTMVNETENITSVYTDMPVMSLDESLYNLTGDSNETSSHELLTPDSNSSESQPLLLAGGNVLSQPLVYFENQTDLPENVTSAYTDMPVINLDENSNETFSHELLTPDSNFSESQPLLLAGGNALSQPLVYFENQTNLPENVTSPYTDMPVINLDESLRNSTEDLGETYVHESLTPGANITSENQSISAEERTALFQPLVSFENETNSPEVENVTLIPELLTTLHSEVQSVEVTTVADVINTETTVEQFESTSTISNEPSVASHTSYYNEDAKVVEFDLEGEPDSDLEFAVFGDSEGIRFESYNMPEKNESTLFNETLPQDSVYSSAPEVKSTTYSVPEDTPEVKSSSYRMIDDAKHAESTTYKMPEDSLQTEFTTYRISESIPEFESATHKMSEDVLEVKATTSGMLEDAPEMKSTIPGMLKDASEIKSTTYEMPKDVLQEESTTYERMLEDAPEMKSTISGMLKDVSEIKSTTYETPKDVLQEKPTTYEMHKDALQEKSTTYTMPSPEMKSTAYGTLEDTLEMKSTMYKMSTGMPEMESSTFQISEDASKIESSTPKVHTLHSYDTIVSPILTNGELGESTTVPDLFTDNIPTVPPTDLISTVPSINVGTSDTIEASESSVSSFLTTIPSIETKLEYVSFPEEPLVKIHLFDEILVQEAPLLNMSECGVWEHNVTAEDTPENQTIYSKWPALGFLQMVSEPKFCAAAVISSKYVITSLNCMSFRDNNIDADKWAYVGGLYHQNLSVSGLQNHLIDEIIPYPNSSTPFLFYEYDIALAKLKDEIKEDPYARSSCLPSRQVEANQECFAVGWAQNSSVDDIGKQFKSVSVSIISSDECNKTENYNGMLLDTLICGSPANNHEDICQMELGSPLFCVNQNSHWEVQGLMNLPGPCDLAQPSVFSSTASVKDWIYSVIEKQN